MNKEFIINTASSGSILFGAVLGVIGIGVGLLFNILFGGLLIVAAVLLYFLMRNFANDTTISCQDHGFSIKVENKRKGTSVQDYKWEDVISTQYYEKDSGSDSDGDSTTTSYFIVKTGEGVAFDIHEMSGFAELIEIFNQNTPHLPYYWEKSKGIFSSSGYKRVQRSEA
jgi:hypothetical protein